MLGMNVRVYLRTCHNEIDRLQTDKTGKKPITPANEKHPKGRRELCSQNRRYTRKFPDKHTNTMVDSVRSKAHAIL